MRYFRYKNTDKIEDNAFSLQYKSLTTDEKRLYRKEKILRKISSLVFWAVFALFMAAGIMLISDIPTPSMWLWKIPAFAGKVILYVILTIVSGIAAWIADMPLAKKLESLHIPSMKKAIISRACGHLRDYYGLNEPYVLTKCFDSTDAKFKNHDVCIFVCDGELRITRDLINGFLHGEKDLGCYAFESGEITMSKRQWGNHPAVELKVGDAVFLLAYRARGFIEKNFTLKLYDI